MNRRIRTGMFYRLDGWQKANFVLIFRTVSVSSGRVGVVPMLDPPGALDVNPGVRYAKSHRKTNCRHADHRRLG